jgi:N-acetylneuraminic acid mutarotase
LFLLIGLISTGINAQTIEWKQKAELPKPMRGTAISCNNEIYFMEANYENSEVYEYSSIDDTWKKTANMSTQGWNVNLAEIDGIIYAIGGDPFRDRLESYDPLRKMWKVLTPMPTARQHSNCCVVNDKIYVMGGITSWTKETDKNEVYHPKTNTWQTVSPLPKRFGNPIIASVNKDIYALCGNDLWMYDTSSDTWEAKENSPAWISVMFGSAVIDDQIIFAGGQNKQEKAVSSVHIYNTTSNTWTSSTNLPTPIQLGGITTLNGKIYIIGGCDSDFNIYDSVYEGTLVN